MRPADNQEKPLAAIRRAVLTGLGLILPPLLTIVFILWVAGSVQRYVLNPIENIAREVIVARIDDVRHEDPQDPRYVQLLSGEWIPRNIYDTVRKNPGPVFPTTAEAMLERYVDIRWLTPAVTVPIFLGLLIILCYTLGKLIAARIGLIVWNYFERLIEQLPLIRTVYSTVKQVTDIVFAESEIQFTRVVAVEYPRVGIWSIGFVTGESIPALHEMAGEPMISILMPTSPMPATGFTISIRKSDTLDLDITIDQAIQFVFSCGVVCPGIPKTGMPPADIKAMIESQVNASTA